MNEGWISVNLALPKIIEGEGCSETVLCVGHKHTHPNDIDYVRYEIMEYKELTEKEQTLTNAKGEKIKYGWSVRWWDTNPDLYHITHWRRLPSPPVIKNISYNNL